MVLEQAPPPVPPAEVATGILIDFGDLPAPAPHAVETSSLSDELVSLFATAPPAAAALPPAAALPTDLMPPTPTAPSSTLRPTKRVVLSPPPAFKNSPGCPFSRPAGTPRRPAAPADDLMQFTPHPKGAAEACGEASPAVRSSRGRYNRDAEERGLRSAKRQRGTPRLFAMEAEEEAEAQPEVVEKAPPKHDKAPPGSKLRRSSAEAAALSQAAEVAEAAAAAAVEAAEAAALRTCAKAKAAEAVEAVEAAEVAAEVAAAAAAVAAIDLAAEQPSEAPTPSRRSKRLSVGTPSAAAALAAAAPVAAAPAVVAPAPATPAPVPVAVPKAAAKPKVEAEPAHRSKSPARSSRAPRASLAPACSRAKSPARAAPAVAAGPARPAKELRAAFASVSEYLQRDVNGVVDEELDWEKRVASIGTLPALVADLAAANLLDELLPKFGAPLTAQLSDLRSATVRAVCAVLASLIAHLGHGLAPLVPGVLPQLLKNHFVSIKAISIISSSTVLALMAAAPSQPAHDIIVAHCRDSHHQTRRGSVECLTQQLRSDATEPTGAAALQHALEKLGPLFGALKAVTADADAAVRTAAGKCFWALHAQRPNESGDFMAKLDPAQQKMLKRCQPK